MIPPEDYISLSSPSALRGFLEAAPDAIVVVDPDGLIIIVNQLTEQMFGYARAELVGEALEMLVPERDRGRHVAHRAGYFHKPRTRPMGEGRELLGRRKDGSEFPLEISLSPLATEKGTLVISIIRDTTSRREAEIKFRGLLESAPDGIVVVDREAHIAIADEILGRHFSTFYAPEDVKAGRPEAQIEAALRNGRNEDEGWRIRKDGSRFWANVILTALRNEQGELKGFGKVVRDLSRRRQQEVALRDSEERFRLMVDGVKDYAIITLDKVGNVTSWNDGAERIQGYSEREILGRNIAQFFEHDDVNAGTPQAMLRRAARDDRVETEGFSKHKSGSRYWGETVITAVRDEEGGLRGFSRIHRDLSEKKRWEESQRLLDEVTVTLAGSLELSETLQNAAGFAVPDLADWCVIDLADEHDRLSSRAIAHRDPEKQELAQQLARSLQPDPALQHGAFHVFHTGRSELHPQLDDAERTASLLGAERPELLRELGVGSLICVPMRFRGSAMGVLSLVRASSAQRYDAKDLALAEDFARRVAQAIDNATLYQEAQDAIRARDEFLQIASHELKTPLTPLQIQLDLVRRALSKLPIENERINKGLEIASRQTGRLNRLVDSLLDVSRITAGRVRLEREPLDLAEVVPDVVERFQNEAESAGSELSVSVKNAINGRWDRLRLEQILSNLLSNALKYGAGKPIEVRVREVDDSAQLSITDHGIGIEPEALSPIFGRFERAVSMRHYAGLGLGLFISRQLAEAHDGFIIAESQPGLGSTFTLILPLEETPHSAPTPRLGEARQQ